MRTMHRLLITAAALTATVLQSHPATAKTMGSRLGLGYANQFGVDQDMPSLAVRYYPNDNYGLMGALGVDTRKNNSRFGAQAKILKIVWTEDNLNFYTGAGAGLVSQESPSATGGTKNNSGFDLSGFMGVEFFL